MSGASSSVTMEKGDLPMSGNDDAIRNRARQLWEAEGRPEGRHEDHWRQAQQELKAAPTADLPMESGATTTQLSADQEGGSI